MIKKVKSFTLDQTVIDAIKTKSERLSKKEDRKVSESEIVNKILKKALL